MQEIREGILERAHAIITIIKKTKYSISQISFIDLTACQKLSSLPLDISLNLKPTEKRDLEL